MYSEISFHCSPAPPQPISVFQRVQAAGMTFQIRARACLKKAFCKMCVTICGRFCTNEGGVAGYDNRIWAKDTANWDVQIAGMIFQTRSRITASENIAVKTAPQNSEIRIAKKNLQFPDNFLSKLSAETTGPFHFDYPLSPEMFLKNFLQNVRQA